MTSRIDLKREWNLENPGNTLEMIQSRILVEHPYATLDMFKSIIMEEWTSELGSRIVSMLEPTFEN